MVYSNLYSFSDLLTIFPFGKTKLRQLLLAGVLPVVKSVASMLPAMKQSSVGFWKMQEKKFYIDF